LFKTRAGYIARGFVSSGVPLIVPGLQSIDVSEAGDDLFKLNHDIYATNPVVSDDLRKLLQSGVRPPNLRSPETLERRTAPSGDYWYYRRSPG
jgi:hypothetical protein